MRQAVLGVLLLCACACAQLALKRVALIPFGPGEGIGSLLCADTDHDGCGELIYHVNGYFSRPQRWDIVEYRPFNRYELVKSDTGVYPFPPGQLITGNFYPLDVGDVDRDGKADLAGQVEYKDSGGTYRLAVCTIESRDSCSYPDTLNWYCQVPRFDGERGSTVIADMDRDSAREIVAAIDSTCVFENVADDRESLVCEVFPTVASSYTLADYDLNGRTDYSGYFNWMTRVCECVGDDRYEQVCSLDVGLANGHESFVGHDADQNGRPEFFITFLSGLTLDLYMFEATAEHEYSYYPVDAFVLWPGVDPSGHQGRCADLDGDGVEEVTWSTCSHVHILKATGPHQFQRVFTWANDHGSDYVSNCNAADFNYNGYNELFIGGDHKTSVFEVEAVRVLNPDTVRSLAPSETCQIRWRIFEPPRCDSVSLFLKTDTTIYPGERFWRLDTIATGLPLTDSTFDWVVPDTVLDRAWVVAIAYGPGWQYDESDSAFAIAPPGVAETPHVRVCDWALTVSPNPALGRAAISYDVPRRATVRLGLYDAEGRLMQELVSGELAPGRYSVEFRTPATLPAGIYFIRLDAPGYRDVKKAVVMR